MPGADKAREAVHVDPFFNAPFALLHRLKPELQIRKAVHADPFTENVTKCDTKTSVGCSYLQSVGCERAGMQMAVLLNKHKQERGF